MITSLLVHFSPKSPYFGLKIIFRAFSVDLEKSKFSNFFQFWGIPGWPKKCFCENFALNHLYVGCIFQDFPKILKLARKTYEWAHHCGTDFWISPYWTFGEFLSKILRKILPYRAPKVQKGEIQKSVPQWCAHLYVLRASFEIFGKSWKMRPTNDSAQKIFAKKKFLVIWGFPKIEKNWKILIFLNRQKMP